MPRGLRYGLAVVCLLLIAAGVAGYYYVKTLAPRTRERVIQALQERFDADVELTSLDLSLYPHPTAVAEGLSIRHKGWSDSHPLIYVRRFTAATDFSTLINRRNHVDSVQLEGLVVHIPARGQSIFSQTTEQNHEVAGSQAGNDTTHLRFLIESIVADGARLEIDPKIAGKVPLHYDIQNLTFHSVGPDQAMAFNAKLTNAKPPGLIETAGRFGPWQRDDPRASAVSGNYTFQNANLAVFKGISGILSSTGSYKGVLQHIEVDGTTDTPRFALKRGGEPVHLQAKFHSIVNGTDGDTILDPVDARFLRSEFICAGGIVHESGPRGKTVSLDAIAKNARMEDILRLVMGNGKPLVTGVVDFKTKILIPPGPQDVLDRLKLDGEFAVLSGEFTTPKVQIFLDTLSARARGISKEEQGGESAGTVTSNMRARFKLNEGVASFASLSFNVPGALINLTGKYNLRSEQIDMNGAFQMEATLSQTQSGVKRLLLKALDPLFEKNGTGFTLPIKIAGTKDHPEIGTTVFHHAITIH